MYSVVPDTVKLPKIVTSPRAVVVCDISKLLVVKLPVMLAVGVVTAPLTLVIEVLPINTP